MGCSGLRFIASDVRPAPNDVVVGIGDDYGNSVTAVQAMSGAADSRVVGAHRHFYAVQNAFVEFSVAYESACRLVHAHVHRPQVVRGADDHVGADDQAVFVGGVVVDESAAGGFHASHATAGLGFHLRADVRVRDFRVLQDFDGALAVATLSDTLIRAAVGTDHEIGCGQKDEVQQLVLGMGDGLHQFAKLPAGRGYAEATVHGLVRRQMVHPGTDAADSAHDPRKLLGRLSLDELLEAPQRQYVDAGVLDVAVVVQPNADGRVSFDSRNGLDIDNL